MGPRSCERGKDRRGNLIGACAEGLQWGRVRVNAESDEQNTQGISNDELQWGRVRVNAESLTYLCPSKSNPMLQWGRVRVNAERSPGEAIYNGNYSFNGAAFV